MNLDEVVIEISQRDSSRVILQLARESVTQAGVASAISAQCPILPFNVAGAHVFWIGVPAHNLHITADAASGRIAPRLIACWRAVDFLQLAVIDLRPKRSFNCFQIRPVPVTGDLYPLAQA